MKKALKILLWTLVAAIFIGTFVYLFMNSRTKPTVYSVVSPERRTIEKTTVLTGTIEPRDEIDIKPNISGIISEINVEAGDMVQAGDIIAKIKVVPDEGQLSSAQNRINAAQLALDDVQTRHNRNTRLYEARVISREEFETTMAELERAREELRAARDAYAIVREGVSPSNATQSNTLVRATTSGLVLDVPVKVGASVIQANNFNDGTTIATIADMSKLIFKGTVDETEVGNLRVGQEMTVTVGALPGVELTAILEFISPKSTSSSGANTFEIKGGLAVPKGVSLRSGYSANASVSLETAVNALTVPESILEFRGPDTFVYVLTDSATNSFKPVNVTTGLSDGINVVVTSGVSEGMRLRGAPIDSSAEDGENKRPAGPPHP